MGGIVTGDRRIVLVGFMGAGKTTVGRLLARSLGLSFFDSDAVIEQVTGRRIPDIFVEDGEPAFRELEHHVVTELVRGQPAVVAVGGGAVEDIRTEALLTETDVVYLHVDYAVALDRVQTDRNRPMLQRADLEQVYTARIGTYQRIASLTVETDGRRPPVVVDEILRHQFGR